MNVISSLNAKYFTYNGTQYFRNYVSAVHGNKIEIYNCFERKDVLVPLSHFEEFTVNGASFASANLLQAALLDVTYSRLTASDSSAIDQDNIPKIISAGSIGPLSPNESMASKVADKLNARAITITPKETPVIILATEISNNGLYNYTYKRYKYLFKRGKGSWGLGGSEISSSYLEIINVENLLVDHLLNEPNAVINNLGEVEDGNYLTAANATEWNFLDSGLESEIGPKTYYFSYESDDVLYFVQFVGNPDLYGGVYDLKFTGDDFVSSTDSRITEIPTLEEVVSQGGNLNISQFTNDGNGTSPYATIAHVNGLSVTVNQAAAEMYLMNTENVTLATINLGFLNNEGTTFLYNDVTGNLELINDSNEVLSVVPVSAFVTNLIQQVDFNTTSPQILEFKGPGNIVLDSVTFTIANISGLQTAINNIQTSLNNKVNTNGSNATGTWPINVTGNSATSDYADIAEEAVLWGGSYADFNSTSPEGTAMTHLVGYNSGTNIAKRYTALNVKSWLTIAVNDITGLAATLANMAASIAGKANDEDVVHKTGDETIANNKTFTGSLILTADKPLYFNDWGWQYRSDLGGLDLFKSGVINGVIFAKDNKNVGINTTNPQATLHVAGSSAYNGIAYHYDAIQWLKAGINVQWSSKIDTNNNLRFTNDYFTTIPALTLGADNKVGINTVPNNYALEVNGGIRTSLFVRERDGSGNTANPLFENALIYGSTYANSFAKINGFNTFSQNYGVGWSFKTHSTAINTEIEALRLNPEGDAYFPVAVGINTTNPLAKLHVEGGDVMAGGWNKSIMVSASYPFQIFKSTGSGVTRYGGFSWDGYTLEGLSFWVGATTEDMVNTGMRAFIIRQTGITDFGFRIKIPNGIDPEDGVNKSQLDTIASGKADLVGGKVPASQLPAFVDDVLEYANLAAFPAIGESGKIYVTLDTNKTYRWSGTGYAEISPSVALGETSSTAYRGDRGKTAYDHSQESGNPHNTQIEDIPNLIDALADRPGYQEVVLMNTDQTISSDKTFTGQTIVPTSDIGTDAVNNERLTQAIEENRNNSFHYNTSITGSGTLMTLFTLYPNAKLGDRVYCKHGGGSVGLIATKVKEGGPGVGEWYIIVGSGTIS